MKVLTLIQYKQWLGKESVVLTKDELSGTVLFDWCGKSRDMKNENVNRTIAEIPRITRAERKPTRLTLSLRE